MLDNQISQKMQVADDISLFTVTNAVQNPKGVVVRLMKNMAAHKIPCLILHGAGDEIVTPEASKFLYNRSSATDKSLKIYDGMFHEILNEFEKDTVLSDIREWLDRRI